MWVRAGLAGRQARSTCIGVDRQEAPGFLRLGYLHRDVGGGLYKAKGWKECAAAASVVSLGCIQVVGSV